MLRWPDRGLVVLCAMAGTLVIDHDGVYNPSLLNDRLLLGLKGTMSEFEISLLRQRAMEALKEKIRRGLVLTQVPVGYIRTEDEGMNSHRPSSPGDRYGRSASV
jgi:DNA invertase Pin-like site-specific DNA recombinase